MVDKNKINSRTKSKNVSSKNSTRLSSRSTFLFNKRNNNSVSIIPYRKKFAKIKRSPVINKKEQRNIKQLTLDCYNLLCSLSSQK